MMTMTMMNIVNDLIFQIKRNFPKKRKSFGEFCSCFVEIGFKLKNPLETEIEIEMEIEIEIEMGIGMGMGMG